MAIRMNGRLWIGLLVLVSCGNTTLIIFPGDAGTDAADATPNDAKTPDRDSAAPAHQTLAKDQLQPLGIALSSTQVYWTNVGVVNDGGVEPLTGSVVTATRDGADLKTLVPKQTSPEILQFGAGGASGPVLVWSGNDVVSTLFLATGNADSLAEDQPAVLGVALDGDNAYWLASDGDGVVIETAPFSGGTPTMLGYTIDDNVPGCLAVAPITAGQQFIYATGSNPTGGGGALYRISIDAGGGLMEAIWTTTIGAPYGVAVDHNNVYWAVADPVQGSIYQMPLSAEPHEAGISDCGIPDGPSIDCGPEDSGFGAPILLATGLSENYFVAVDSSHVYFTTNVASGAAYALPIGGGTSTMLAHELNYPGAIAVDDLDNFVYFTTLTTVERVQK
jgi:hypothetical protein